MSENKFFTHQIKHTKGVFEKGIVVKETYDDAKQAYHAYLGAYAYGHDPNTDNVNCMITDMYGAIYEHDVWVKPEEPEEVNEEM